MNYQYIDLNLWLYIYISVQILKYAFSSDSPVASVNITYFFFNLHFFCRIQNLLILINSLRIFCEYHKHCPLNCLHICRLHGIGQFFPSFPVESLKREFLTEFHHPNYFRHALHLYQPEQREKYLLYDFFMFRLD